MLNLIDNCSLSISYCLRGEVMTMNEVLLAFEKTIYYIALHSLLAYVLLVFEDNLLDCNQEIRSSSSEFIREEISSVKMKVTKEHTFIPKIKSNQIYFSTHIR